MHAFKLKGTVYLCDCFDRQELEEIQKTVSRQQEKYQQNVNTKVYMTSLRSFHVNTSFVLNKDDSSYQLSIELQIPIENILIQVHHFKKKFI